MLEALKKLFAKKQISFLDLSKEDRSWAIYLSGSLSLAKDRSYDIAQ